ncbi:MAG: hypothetical protein J3T61_10710 [Candidatus Brocadiales bacterium]|nr:hypothetical protein [Candidatus Bathyanammoxibius sp.]
MTKRIKVYIIALIVLGCVAIGVNVYFGFFQKTPKLIRALDLSTGEIKELTPEEAAKIREKILGK